MIFVGDGGCVRISDQLSSVVVEVSVYVDRDCIFHVVMRSQACKR